MQMREGGREGGREGHETQVLNIGSLCISCRIWYLNFMCKTCIPTIAMACLSYSCCITQIVGAEAFDHRWAQLHYIITASTNMISDHGAWALVKKIIGHFNILAHWLCNMWLKQKHIKWPHNGKWPNMEQPGFSTLNSFEHWHGLSALRTITDLNQRIGWAYCAHPKGQGPHHGI